MDLRSVETYSAEVSVAVVPQIWFHSIGMASRFNKKSNITLGKNSEDWMDAKSMGAFINEALESHINSETDLSTASPELKRAIEYRLQKDSSS